MHLVFFLLPFSSTSLFLQFSIPLLHNSLTISSIFFFHSLLSHPLFLFSFPRFPLILSYPILFRFPLSPLVTLPLFPLPFVRFSPQMPENNSTCTLSHHCLKVSAPHTPTNQPTHPLTHPPMYAHPIVPSTRPTPQCLSLKNG